MYRRGFNVDRAPRGDASVILAEFIRARLLDCDGFAPVRGSPGQPPSKAGSGAAGPQPATGAWHHAEDFVPDYY